MNAAKKIILLLWLLIVASLGNVSALTPGASENRVWQKSFETLETRQAEPLQTLGGHQENEGAGYDYAPDSLLVADTGATLADDLAAAANRAANTVGPGRGPVYGTQVHTAFAQEVGALGNASVRTEVSFMNGIEVPYGTAGSVRLDAVQFGGDGQVLNVFDLKTGSATLTPQRILQIQQQVGSPVPVNLLRP